MKRITAFVLLFLLIFPTLTLAGPNYGEWAKESIDIANRSGLISETLVVGDYTKPVNRIQMAELIVKAYENVKNNRIHAMTKPFSDTISEYAAIVQELGIMSGRGDGIFSPYDDVTRQEISKIILTFKAAVENTQLNLNYSKVPAFSDMNNVSSWAVPYVSKAYESGIIKGYENGTFLPYGKVSYQEAIILILRAAKLNQKAKPVIENFKDSPVLTPGQSVSLSVNTSSDYRVYAYSLSNGKVSKIGTGSNKSFTLNYSVLKPQSLYYIYVESGGVYSDFVSVYTDKYSLFIDVEDFAIWGVKRISWNSIPGAGKVSFKITEQRNSRHFGDIAPNTPYTCELSGVNYTYVTMYPNCVYTIEISAGEYRATKTVVCQSVSGEKASEIYNSYPATKEEADKLMVTVTVPVWKLSGGNKVSSKAQITVHKDIADKIKLVFEEIYNGKEKFPIKDVGAYNWRGGTTEHNGGTAIDINSNENYCLYSNGTVVGSHWSPYKDPYSITPYGDVIHAFETHGFTWGGDAWNSTKDYMHFSYLGT